MKKGVNFSPEVRERAVRMVAQCCGGHSSQWAAAQSIATKIGCTTQTLLTCVRQSESGTTQRERPTTAEQKRVMELERGVCNPACGC